MKTNFFIKQINDIKTYGFKELLRKLIIIIFLPKYLISFLFILIAILPCLFLRILRPIFLVRFALLPGGTFGDMLLYPALYYCQKKLKINHPQKNYQDLFFIPAKVKICNEFLVKFWKKKLKIFPPYLIHPLYEAMKIIPGSDVHFIKIFNGERERDVNNLYEKCQPILSFNEEELKKGEETLKKFGLNNKDKFICLAIRDSAYDKMRISSRFTDWSYQEFRNNNLDNYKLAIEELTRRGYFVFRMGVVVEKPLISKNPKIIDYANSDMRSDFMDIYLASKCSFAVTTMFGAQALFELFNKPCAQISVPLAAAHTHCKKNYLLTKHHILKKSKKKLSLSEIFKSGAAFSHDAQFFKENGIDVLENSSEEIKDLVLEVADLVENKLELSEEEKNLQLRFKQLFKINYDLPNFKKKSDPYWHKTKFHKKININFSTKFLLKHSEWLN